MDHKSRATNDRRWLIEVLGRNTSDHGTCERRKVHVGPLQTEDLPSLVCRNTGQIVEELAFNEVGGGQR